MKTLKELIIVHVQEIYMGQISVPIVKNSMLKTINKLVDKSDTDVHIRFWLDSLESGGETAIKFPSGKDICIHTAPAGHIQNYKLHSNSVTLTGLWIGACVNNAIMSIVRSYIENSQIHLLGKLTINLVSTGICKPNKLLEDMYAASIESTFMSGFQYDSSEEYFRKSEAIQSKGLAVSLIRKHSNPEKSISKTHTLVEPKNQSGSMFIITLNII